MRDLLDQPWVLSATGGQVPPSLVGVEVPATVPGTVHTDLLAAGLIDDPYLDTVEQEVQWIGRTAWRYATRLQVAPAAPGERVDLVFSGLDTVCDVRLDGHVLGSPSNMHRTHRYDVTSLLAAGGNDLVVDFAGQLDAAEAMSLQQVPRVHTNDHPFNAIRKMACNFGWDWGPDLVTAGIWRDVHVERWHTARLADVRTLVTVEGTTGVVTVHADVVRSPGSPREPLELTAHVDGAATGPVTARTDVTNGHVVLRTEIPDVALWWPRGYGAQPLHDLRIALSTTGAEPEELDHLERRIGFRTVTLDTTPDDRGVPFVAVGQRQADPRQGRQLDPGRLLPAPRRPGPLRARASATPSTPT